LGQKRKLKTEALTVTERKRRVYPEVGTVDTMTDVRELIKAIESDDISEEKKRQRLQFMFSLTSSKTFRNQFRGNIGKARSAFERAYKRHMKGGENG